MMGIIRSKLVRPLKTYNVEHRAQKIISQEKPKVAPYYPSVHEQIKVAKEASPNFMEEHYKKDSELYSRLKDVFVTSDKTENPQIERKEEKALPFSTTTPDDFEFGFWEPKKTSEGRCHLREVIVMLADQMTNKEISAAKLAEEHKLNVKDVENLLEYYRVLQIFQPSKREHGFREEDIGLPQMNSQGILEWKSMEQHKKWKEEDAAEKARINKEKETQKNDKAEVSQMDKQTESSHKIKATESSHRDKETGKESSEIDKKKGIN